MTAVSLVVCYLPVLSGMFNQWVQDQDMAHGILVPLVIPWIVWKERSRWMNLPASPSAWGFAILAVAACVHFVSNAAAGLFAGSVAFVLSVAGVVLCLGGSAFLRTWSFPFLLMLFSLPKLAVVYNQATLPLQILASRLAAGMLLAGGAVVTREGNILDVGGHRIAVVEACSGVRYLLSLGFMAVVFAYLSDAKPWMRVALLAAAVPVAILANAIRVAVSASIPVLDSGTLHDFLGGLVFVLCLVMLVVVHRLFNTAYARYHD
ncbi:MAG: exosortase/archaeosortase family protein [Bryobacteraceae bacterium]